MKIIAHRGASFLAPENTISAFRMGIEEGADGIELDVRLTSDGRIIALHDVTTARTSDKLFRADETPFRLIETCDAGSWKSSKFLGERIPSLDAVLDFMPENRDIFIEIKCGTEIIPFLSELLRTYHRHADNVVIFGFGYDVAAEAKRLLPEYKTLWIGEFGYNIQIEDEMYDHAEKMVRRANLDGFSTRADSVHVPVMRERLKDLHLNVWTVDDPAEALFYQETGVDSLTTNRPERIIDIVF
ncbi:glycerophosphodiester phosphodiesterase family protein [Seleniivibrio woodruffii]|uniref:glycerophosphodiester phosphodiesterase family protein n=1 Tax=Seleniivibrio woodruffii TaxID=1078050 RepID=UPI0026ED60A6|nr:glycerophosphodiester phosphodiesterase family protein [Seleniivibrio woodruffii]